MRCTLTQLQALRRTLPTFNAAVTNSSVTGAPNPRGGGVVDSTTPDPIVAAAKAQQQAPPTAPFTAAHRAYVKSLYKRMLKNELDWTVHRGLWRDRCIEIRAEFERHRDIRNPREVARVLDAAEKQLKEYLHPDPYKRPTGEDGTKWERNLPPIMYSEADKKAFKESIGDSI